MSDDAKDDLTLLDRWCAGDKDAGELLFKKHFSSVYRFLQHNAQSEAEELAQNVFLACVKNRAAFQKQSSFRTYLFAIARNMIFSYWRKRSQQGDAIDFNAVSWVDLTTSQPTRMIRAEERDHLLNTLRTLPFEQQLLLELAYWEGMSSDELAEVFDIEPATARSRLSRARADLRERLDARAEAVNGR